jgi:hypothetical protein
MLFIEFRLLPALALVGSIYALVEVRRGREGRGLVVMAAAAGLLTYVYLEVVLYRATDDVLFGSLAHEVAEFWFLVATAELLRRSFGSRTRSAATARGARSAARALPVAPPEV